MWPPDGERVFLAALRAQAEGFADSVRGEPTAGATADDAAAALEAAGLAVAALAGIGAPDQPEAR